jgi:hypothetical protein
VESSVSMGWSYVVDGGRCGWGVSSLSSQKTSSSPGPASLAFSSDISRCASSSSISCVGEMWLGDVGASVNNTY